MRPLSLGYLGLTRPGGGGGGAAAPISAIAADGWQATGAVSATPFNFTAAGYDATGAAAQNTTPITSPRLVRDVYPNQLNDTADVALSLVVPQGATISGCTNSSTVTAPTPFGAWVMPGRSLVGTTLDWEVIAFHYYARSQKQVACVRVRATDGTLTTAWQVVATTSISTLCEDAVPLEVYKGTLSLVSASDGVTPLADGLITLQGQMMPWVGALTDSASSSVAREFSPRYFLKNATRLANPPLAYVASAGASPPGNDTTGVWHTTAATAAATPFLTVGGALQAVNDATRGTPQTGGVADGCRIRIVDTVSLGTCTTSRPQNVAAVIVERAPATSRAAAIVTHTVAMRARLGIGTLTAPLTEGAIRFYDCTINRTVNTTFQGEAATQLNVQFHNCTIANASTAGTWLSNAHDWFFGVTLTGFNGNLGQTALQHRIMRGLTVDFANGNAPEAWVTVGCQFTRVKGCTVADGTKGAIWYGNKYLNPDSTTACINYTGTVTGGDLGPIMVVQNLVEVLHTTASTPSIRISSDEGTDGIGNITHAVIAHNTTTGYGSAGRWNIVYDEDGTTARFHKLVRCVGNITGQLNTKGDVFELNAARLGQFEFSHGVGCEGNFTMFRTNSGNFANEMQTYPGPGSIIGTSTTIRNDPLFTNYQGSDNVGGAAGAGGGTYTLQGASTAKGIVSAPLLAYDIAGNARAAANEASGAYTA